MSIETEEDRLQDADIRDFFTDVSVGNFADRSVRRLFENKRNVQGVVEIVASDLAALIDFDRLVPMNRSLLPENLREQEADMVFRVPFKSGGRTDELLIYLLIEHQSTVDEMMGFRVLFYMMLIWDAERRRWETGNVPKRQRRLSPILPIVFYTGERRWQTPLSLDAVMNLPEELSRFVPRFDTLFLNVKATDAATLTQTDHPLGWLLRVLQQEGADEAAIRRVLIEALSYPDALSAQEASQRREAIAYLVALVLHRRPAEEHQDLINLIDRYTHDMEVAPMAETMAEILLERGIEQGIEQGERKNAIKNILTILTTRFSETDAEVAKQKLESILDIDRLEQLLLTAVKTPNLETFLQALEP